MAEATLVTVHGFWSSSATWDRLCASWQADEELKDLRIHRFGYPSPKKRRLPLASTRIPDFDDLAQMLAAEYATKLGTASSIAFVTHSQGGLILQRFLAWMISENRARELARIRTVIMLACPNGGSQYLASIRHALGYGRHPQAANLKVLNKQVIDTQRAVLARVIHASGIDDHQCRIPFHVYAAGSDAIVPTASAQATFPGAGTLAGNHFSVLDPAAPGNRTADIVKHHILTDLSERPSASVHVAAPGKKSQGCRPERGGRYDHAIRGSDEASIPRTTFSLPDELDGKVISALATRSVLAEFNDAGRVTYRRAVVRRCTPLELARSVSGQTHTCLPALDEVFIPQHVTADPSVLDLPKDLR